MEEDAGEGVAVSDSMDLDLTTARKLDFVQNRMERSYESYLLSKLLRITNN